MKNKKAWIMGAGRVVLAVVLLGAVFKFAITIYDTVELADGRTVTGTLVEWSDERVEIRSDGEVLSFESSELAADDGASAVKRGLVSILKGMTPGSYVAGLLLLGVIPSIAAVRWRLLLSAQGIHIGFWWALELTYLGLFFNNLRLGLTGGDVVKAYYATKITSTKKTNAVVTVFLDRLVGLAMLAMVAGVAVCLTLALPARERSSEYSKVAYLVAVFMALVVVGGVAFFSRRLRRVGKAMVRKAPGYTRVRGTKVAGRLLEMLRRIDSALFLYRYKKRVIFYACVLSVVAHSGAITAIYCFGLALQIREATLVNYFAIVPICFIVSSVPLTPAGWGVGEVVFQFFFGIVGVARTPAVTLSVIYRLTQAIWTLPGAVVMMFQRERPTVEEVEKEVGGGLPAGEDASGDD